jgi:hypothetical protein
MELRLSPEMQARLEDLARESGCPGDELVERLSRRTSTNLTASERCSIAGMTI